MRRAGGRSLNERPTVAWGRRGWVRHLLLCLVAGLMVAGCGAVSTSIEKRDLDVHTKMSETIFLDPVATERRTVFVEVRNTSDRDNFNIEAAIVSSIEKGGYRVVDNPDTAHYWLQANVLMVEETTAKEAKQSLLNGYGGPLGGAVVGAVVAKTQGAKKEKVALAALVGAGVGWVGEKIGDAMVDDVLFAAVTDVQVVEQAKEGVEIHSQSEQRLAQGQTGSLSQQYQEIGDRKKYRTRVVSTANQANLEYAQAKGLLASSLTRSLANLF